MKRAYYIPIFVLWFVLIASIFTIPHAYSYFDKLFTQIAETIMTGDWRVSDPLATYQNVNQLIADRYDETNPNDQVKINYLNGVMYDTDTLGNPILDEVFQGYKLSEITTTLNLIDEYTANFLYNNNGVYNYLTTTVNPINVNYNQTILPTETIFINRILLNADLTNAAAMNLTITLSATLGTDISDFSLEVLIDGNPFVATFPFDYTYLHSGMTKVSSLVKRFNLSTFSTISYSNEVRSATTTTLYQHNYNFPTFPGSWSRFPTGPSIYLNTPSSFVISKSTTITGLYLRGSADGSTSELTISIMNRQPQDNATASVIPIILVLSRGQSNNGTLPNQTNIMPTIQMKVVR